MTSTRVRTLSNHLTRLSPSAHRRRMSRDATQGLPLSPVPKNPLGEGRYIRTAAALIIGDEILNGKTRDSNSNYFARYCFVRGIDLKRVEIIPDDEDEIIEASRRMAQNYDFVITTGGIGPTHDDITYASLAKAFDQPLAHHAETISRMRATFAHLGAHGTRDEAQEEATLRMALFPARAEVLFVARDMWVPVVRLVGTLCVFPGIPRLFEALLEALTPFLALPPLHERPLRVQVFTTRPESRIAPYLAALQRRVRGRGIQVGSYPVLQKGVCVSLIGRHEETVMEVVREVESEVEGKVVSDEEVESAKKEANVRSLKGLCGGN